jgi:hypothetical protein
MKHRTTSRKRTETKGSSPRMYNRYVTDADPIATTADDATSGDGLRIEHLRGRSARGKRNALKK